MACAPSFVRGTGYIATNRFRCAVSQKYRGLTRMTHRAAVVQVSASDKPVLYDMPVSNNGARNRLIIYWKGLEDVIDIKSPAELGGLKSDEYLALNPQGKMPLLVMPEGLALPESEVISQYLVAKYAATGVSLVPNNPEDTAKANLAARIHDCYIQTVQAVMYRACDVDERAAGIAQIAAQLQVLEDLCEAGTYFIGSQPSTADAALFPTFVFMDFMLPAKFGWEDVFKGKPKLRSWWETMKADEAGMRVFGEINGALQGWDESGRWDKLGIMEQLKNHPDRKWAY